VDDGTTRHSSVALLHEKPGIRGDGRGQKEFVLFSKSGFVDGLADELGDDWSLFDPRRMDEILVPNS